VAHGWEHQSSAHVDSAAVAPEEALGAKGDITPGTLRAAGKENDAAALEEDLESGEGGKKDAEIDGAGDGEAKECGHKGHGHSHHLTQDQVGGGAFTLGHVRAQVG
jgi:hypothetical protein